MAKLPTHKSSRVMPSSSSEDEERVVQKNTVVSDSESESESGSGSGSESEREDDPQPHKPKVQEEKHYDGEEDGDDELIDDDGEDDDSEDGESDDYENNTDEEEADDAEEDGKELRNSTQLELSPKQEDLELSQPKKCRRLEKSVEVEEKEKPSKRAKIEAEDTGERYPHLNEALKSDSLSLKFPYKEAIHLLDPHQLEDLDEQWKRVNIKYAEYRANKASVFCRQYNWLFEAYKNHSSKK